MRILTVWPVLAALVHAGPALRFESLQRMAWIPVRPAASGTARANPRSESRTRASVQAPAAPRSRACAGLSFAPRKNDRHIAPELPRAAHRPPREPAGKAPGLLAGPPAEVLRRSGAPGLPAQRQAEVKQQWQARYGGQIHDATKIWCGRSWRCVLSEGWRHGRSDLHTPRRY